MHPKASCINHSLIGGRSFHCSETTRTTPHSTDRILLCVTLFGYVSHPSPLQLPQHGVQGKHCTWGQTKLDAVLEQLGQITSLL